MFLSAIPIRMLFKLLAISCFILSAIHIFSTNLWCRSSRLLIYDASLDSNYISPTNTTHIAFGIASSSRTWRNRRYYIESWWRPNLTRGFLFLEKTRRDFFPWSPSSPPLRLFEDTSRYRTRPTRRRSPPPP